MIYLVVTSSNNVRLCVCMGVWVCGCVGVLVCGCVGVCVCALNGVVIGYYTLGTAIFHYYFFSLAGPRDTIFVFPIRAKLGLTPKWLMARTHIQVAGAQVVDQVT